MLGFKSARGRAVLAGAVLVVLLAGVATLAVWRAYDDQQQHHEMEHASAAATALEHAQAEFWQAQATLSALVFSDDPALIDDYHDVATALEQNLSQARAEALAAGEADKVAALDDLAVRIGQFNDTANLGPSVLLEADVETGAQLATALMPGMVSEAKAIIADLEALVDEEQQELAAKTAAADRAADTTLWLLIGFSAAAFLVATGTIAVLIVWLVRPLAALRASARAITSGDPEARAEVSGPKEVASLASDFNEMTDALAAKTQEYIDTTNLTGDLIAKLDKHGRWAFLNDAACQFLGKPRDELLGTDSTAYVHPEDVEPTAQAIRETRARKNLTTGFVNRQVTPIGTRVVEWNGYPLFDEDGHYAGIQVTGRDISERKRMEEALRTKDCAIEASIDGIALADPEGILTYVNPSLLKMWGYDDDSEMLGKHITQFWQEKEKTRQIGRALRDKGGWVGELVAARRDGSTFDVQLSASMATNALGKPVSIMGSFVDITERKRAEEALQESEEKWRSLAENVPNIIIVVHRDGTIQFVNRTVSGITVEETLGRSVYEFIPPDYQDTVRKSIEQVFQTGKVGSYQVMGVGPDGRPSWYETQLGPIKHDGRVVAATLIATDITERKQAEQELASSEERLKILFEFAPDAYYLHDSQGTFLDGNKAAEELLGYKNDELIGKNMLEAKILLPDQIPKVAASLARNAQGQPTGPDEYTLIRKDGSRIAVESRGFPVKIRGQTLILGIARDTTTRRHAEEALRASESKYRTLLHNLPQRIFSKDKSSVYVSCNDNYARDLHIIPDEIAGKTDHDFYPQELADKYRADDKRIMKSGKTEDLEERYIQDGQEVFVHTVKTPVRDGDGNVIGILGIFWDITERKRAEEERERLHAELEVRAITDSLTGLYNHAHFFQRLEEEIKRSKRYGRGFAVVMMDVDNFKHYNDSRSHQAGDEALRLIADCIRTAIRRSDIAFRYGGDEFAAILLHADSPRAQAIVNRINGCIAARLKEMDDPAAAWLGLSAGVACFPEDGTTADDLVKVADAALYDAKRVASARRAMQRGQAIEPLASPSNTPDEKHQRMLSAAATSLATALQDLSTPDALANLDLRTIAAIGAAAEIKDPYIHDHQERVSQGAAALAEKMGLSAEQVQDIRVAGLLHDIGKVSVSEGILNKPGKLTEEEYAQIKEHSALGAMIVAHAEGLQCLVKIVRHHHERFDGTGYPDGLTGEDIPLEARILAVVDVFDAMTHERSYRKALSRAESIAELERSAGTQFDPAVVKAFLALLEKRGEEPPALARAASKHRQLAAARAPARGKR